MPGMRRREFVTLLGGAAAAWPLAARAQQAERVRLIGVLMNITADDLPQRANIAAFQQAQSGWTDGRNVKIDVRWSGGDVVRLRKDAEELLGLRPDVIVAGFGPTTGVLQQLTRTVPIVFTTVVDPVGAGFVDSLVRPGGNATGFIQAEYTLSGKWLELLREIAPQVSGRGEGAAAISLLSDAQFFSARRQISSLAAMHRLPVMYESRDSVDDGGLISYGASIPDLTRRAAVFVVKVINGAKPGDLPIEQPTKFELVINLRTAKALGLTVPETLLARADEVIE